MTLLITTITRLLQREAVEINQAVTDLIQAYKGLSHTEQRKQWEQFRTQVAEQMQRLDGLSRRLRLAARSSVSDVKH
jgi:hypothetical protein